MSKLRAATQKLFSDSVSVAGSQLQALRSFQGPVSPSIQASSKASRQWPVKACRQEFHAAAQDLARTFPSNAWVCMAERQLQRSCRQTLFQLDLGLWHLSGPLGSGLAFNGRWTGTLRGSQCKAGTKGLSAQRRIWRARSPATPGCARRRGRRRCAGCCWPSACRTRASATARA